MTPQEVRQALSQVLDPEIGENLVDLGLVKEIDLDAQRVVVTLIPTSATCPMADVLIADAEAALRRVCPPGVDIEVTMDWATAWDPSRLSPALKARFGW